MNEQLHIIITGDSGKTLRLPTTRKRLVGFSMVTGVILLVLTIASLYSLSLFTDNRSMSKQLAELQNRVDESDAIIAEFQREADQERLKLNLELANLKLDNVTQKAAFKEEKEMLISTAVSELNERSELIQTIMQNIGIKVQDQKPEKPENSGGPYIAAQPDIHDELIYKADTYLQTIKHLPLGRPVNGSISSGFGKRKDPVNGKRSFHEGIDFRGKRGDKVYATAAGVVKRAFKNGSYGNFVEIDHQNGYTTSFAHLQSYIVNKGDKVQRGQLIGLVGNTGRSTGPHLHYEVLYKGKPVNPTKYMQVAKLLVKNGEEEQK